MSTTTTTGTGAPTGTPGYPFPTRDGIAPDPGYALARSRGGPVPVDVGGGRRAWLVTAMDDVRRVHADPVFSRAAAAAEPALPGAGLAPPAGSLLSLDEPDHGRVRALVSGAFSARRIAALAPRVAGLARGLLDPLPADEPVDLVAGYARPLSVAVIGGLLGVPDADHERFAAWTDAFLSTAGGPETGRARGELAGYVGGLLRAKAADPADDLLSHLAAQLRTGADGRELVLLAMAVLVAGHETTANHLASSLLTVLGDPAVADGLRGRPDAVGAAVEELLRAVSLGSVGGFPRVATADVELSGVPIRAGELVIAAINAANRDPAAFDDPDRIDLERFAGRPPTHVGFGSGMHHCLGAALARLELAEGLTAVLDTRPHARLDTVDGYRWQRDSLVRGLVALPVRLGARSDPDPRP